MNLTKSQRILLKAISDHDGDWNDYKLGRFFLSKLESPAEFQLQPLLKAGYVEERSCGDEPLPRLHITEAGKAALRRVSNTS